MGFLALAFEVNLAFWIAGIEIGLSMGQARTRLGFSNPSTKFGQACPGLSNINPKLNEPKFSPVPCMPGLGPAQS